MESSELQEEQVMAQLDGVELLSEQTSIHVQSIEMPRTDSATDNDANFDRVTSIAESQPNLGGQEEKPTKPLGDTADGLSVPQDTLAILEDPKAPTKEPSVAEHGPDISKDDGNCDGAGQTTPTKGGITLVKRPFNIGTVGSVFSGNKIQHLKKDDGIPLWRKDIQHDFLQYVFHNEQRVFTMPSDGTPGHTFAETYIDCMARSSKTSRVLREKLYSDPKSALNMAMICLLVNIGRMNTTLNFFPNMRAQLRSFHAIPSMQVGEDTNAYKQLQDAPRLKSILKGASEDTEQPSLLDMIVEAEKPRTNPVHLVFVMSQYAPRVSELHFQAPREFFDLVMRQTLSSISRANAFLWLMWWYLESDFSDNAALENPFGAGIVGDNTNGRPLKVPSLESLTEEQANLENVDPPEELEYGEQKRIERRKYLDEDESMGPPNAKRTKRAPEEGNSILGDGDMADSMSPSPTMLRKASVDQGRANARAPSPIGDRSRSPCVPAKVESALQRQARLRHATHRASSPVASVTFNQSMTNSSRRSRPETSHQRAVNQNRRKRVDHIVYKQLTSHQSRIRMQKRQIRSTYGMLVMNRTKEVPDTYDSEDEKSWGPAGLVPTNGEIEDYGEEAIRHRRVLDRAIRCLLKLEASESPRAMEALETPGQRMPGRKGTSLHDSAGESGFWAQGAEAQQDSEAHWALARTPSQEQLDDLDLDLLGEARNDGGASDSDETQVYE